jgi:hypothetical protein
MLKVMKAQTSCLKNKAASTMSFSHHTAENNRERLECFGVQQWLAVCDKEHPSIGWGVRLI